MAAGKNDNKNSILTEFTIKNRVSRLFLRGDSRASKKSKSADFGFFLYLLAKIARYWLFSQNNHGLKASLFYWIFAFTLVRIQ